MSETKGINEKRNVYINQFNSASARNLMPLAAGLLYSQAKSIPKITEAYNLGLEIMRDQPENIVARYKNPFLLAYSCYFWNLNQSLLVAELAKKHYPNTLIVVGGPSVPIREGDIKEFFKKYSFIDVIVGGEGEHVLTEILLALNEGKDLSSIEGISFRDKGNINIKARRPYITDFSSLPSPYLDGTFDQLLSEYSNVLTGVVLETNRGCPFTCSFCFWGGPDSKISQFPIERVFKELDWISQNKISYIFGADANFGILKRDIDIAKHLADLHKTTGYPKILVINWTKNATEKIFDIVDVLSDGGVTFMLTTSVQSRNPETLEAIKRSNIRLESFQKILEEAAKRKFHAYSELILGLPLETYETFKDGIRKTLTHNLNYHFNIYNCIIIPGTEMAHPDYVHQYDIKTRRCELHFGKTKDIETYVPEYQDIVVSTSTMPIEDWRKSYTFGYFSKAIFGFRLSFFIFLYLKKEYNIDFVDMIEHIIEKSSNYNDYSTISSSLDVLTQLQDSILNNGRETIKLGWARTTLHPEVASSISLLRYKEKFYSELMNLILLYLEEKNISVDINILKEVFVYQFCRVPAWNNENDHIIKFNYNFEEYFEYNNYSSPMLMRRSIPVILSISESKNYENVDDFMVKQIYGGMVFELAKSKRMNDYTEIVTDALEFFNRKLRNSFQLEADKVQL